MSAAPSIPIALPATTDAPDRLWRRVMGSARVVIGGAVLAVILLACVLSLPWTIGGAGDGILHYDNQDAARSLKDPAGELPLWMGTDKLGRSLLGRCLAGGAISLFIGLAAAVISVFLGVTVGLIAGYRGGWIDALLMRSVDVLFALPYVLMVILIKVALEGRLTAWFGNQIAANLVVLFVAIGSVSWLTMARVIRGQVLSLRSQPFVEAARAAGLRESRIFLRHLLPNLTGPIIVYATLIIPQAILQESFLSFLGIGIQPPLPTWGSLASDGLLPALNTIDPDWWLLLFPCVLLAVTLLSLNFLGDGLRDVFDPKREAAKI
jgi:oligopeptide transport system permease protein